MNLFLDRVEKAIAQHHSLIFLTEEIKTYHKMIILSIKQPRWNYLIFEFDK